MAAVGAGAAAEGAGAAEAANAAKKAAASRSAGESVKSAARKAPKAAGRKLGAAAAATHGGTKAVLRGNRTTPAQAKGMVVFALVVAGGAVALSDFKAGVAPDLRLGVGVLFGGVLLSALADVMPEVAGPLAMLVIIGVLLTPRGSSRRSPGQDLIDSIRAITRSK